ncbi:MAG TPA: isoprenylcysteine carboxylmethyltransferase family protein [Geomonas sp.]|nr:isoprenylcysteine carboxylmethyltransferase family protein [Geomonas sp.]
MDLIRYLIALMLIAAVPVAIVFWLLVHPFTAFWRRMGTGKAYTVLFAVLVAVIATMLALHRSLLVSDFGLNVPLAGVGVLFLLVSGWLLFKLRQKLSLKAMLGVPELSAESEKGSLIADGIYAKIRHPRYTQMTLAIFGYALISNYPAAYGAFIVWCLGIYAVTVLEERELECRFGEAYGRYRKRVPRFVPRFGQRHKDNMQP